VSTPGHSQYGKYLNIEEAHRLTAPQRESVQVVRRWLRDSGIKNSGISSEREWIRFSATTDQANSMMNTKFQVYRHLGRRDTDSLRTTKVELPKHVLRHIQMIHPTTKFDMISEQLVTIHNVTNISEAESMDNQQQDDCIQTVKPKCLIDLYKVGGVSVKDPEKVGRIGILGFLGELARESMLPKFAQNVAPWLSGRTFTIESVWSKLYNTSAQTLELT
jgi:tripeptidyl-peptidase I